MVGAVGKAELAKKELEERRAAEIKTLIGRNDRTIDSVGTALKETKLPESAQKVGSSMIEHLNKSNELFRQKKYEEGLKQQYIASVQAKSFFSAVMESYEKKEATQRSVAKVFNAVSYLGARDAVFYVAEKISPGARASIKEAGISSPEEVGFAMAALSVASVVPVTRGAAAATKLAEILGPKAMQVGEIVLRSKTFRMAAKEALPIAQNVAKEVAATAKYVRFISRQFEKLPAAMEVVSETAEEIGHAVAKYMNPRFVDGVTTLLRRAVRTGGSEGVVALNELKESLSTLNGIGHVMNARDTLRLIHTGKLWDSFAQVFGKEFTIIGAGKLVGGAMAFDVMGARGAKYATTVFLGKELPASVRITADMIKVHSAKTTFVYKVLK